MTETIVDKSDNRRNISILDLNIKQLSLTATIKEIDTNDNHIDNLDEKYWKYHRYEVCIMGYNKQYITDYNLLTPKLVKRN